jgi:predicted nucleotidyltransferase component of viral defense system
MNYSTAKAFRQALNDRLAVIAKREGLDLSRLQRRVAFERFLTRVFQYTDHDFLLKGGYALELRLGGKARATIDLDFAAPLLKERELLETLQTATETDTQDFFRFVLGLAVPPELVGPPEGGFRFRVEVYLDRPVPFTIFFLDVGMGDAQVNPTEYLEPSISLEFAGVSSARFPVTPLPEHFAEKLHAYTRPRSQRTRVKDLVDLLLMIQTLGVKPDAKVRVAVAAVFNRYQTHPVPTVETLEPPPESWQKPFAVITKELSLEPDTLQQAHDLLQGFLEGLDDSKGNG